jgi:hypothetical protein
VVVRWTILPLGLLLVWLTSWAAAQVDGSMAAPMGYRRAAAVQPVQYDAHYDYPGEPLGFRGALMEPAMATDPVPPAGLFDQEYDQYEQIHEPLDLDAPAPATSSGEWVRNGCWYFQQSVEYMSRSTGVRNSIQLCTDFSFIGLVLPHDRAFLQIPVGMGFDPGLRSTFGRYLGRDARNRDHALEFTYLGLTHWGAAGGLTSLQPDALFSNIDPSFHVAAFNGSNKQTFAQTSDFNSYELNYRIDRRLSRDRMVYTRDSTWVRECTPTTLPSLFAGIRAVSINERLAWFAQSGGLVPANGAYHVATHNDLVGVQAGMDWFYERSDWRVGIRTKGGSLVNWTTQSSQVQILDSNGTPLQPNRDEHAREHIAAFVGELNFIGQYQIRPKFGLRFSYDLMWVTNLTLAQNQLTFNPNTTPEISASNSLFFQGLSVGCELLR